MFMIQDFWGCTSGMYNSPTPAKNFLHDELYGQDQKRLFHGSWRTAVLTPISTLKATSFQQRICLQYKIFTHSCGYITSDKRPHCKKKVAWVSFLITVLRYKKLSKAAQRSKSHISNYDAVLWCGFPLLKKKSPLCVLDLCLLSKLSLRAPTMEEKSWVTDGKS